MAQSRREFLLGAGGAGLSAATMGTLSNALTAFPANAADTSGYKALVCLFLFGGLDNHDTVLPFDQASYDRYAEIRGSLLSLYGSQPGGNSRARDRLLPLTPTNAASFGGREFALPEEMAGIHGLFQAGNAAIIGNVGPLIEPVTRTTFENESALLPKRLFSHNDQQATWMSNAPEGAQFGWGGLFADNVLSGAPTTDPFSAIATFNNSLFLSGQTAQAYQVSTGGAAEIEVLRRFEDGQFDAASTQAFQALRTHFAAANYAGANLISRDVAAALGTSLTTNETYNTAIEGVAPFTTAFPENFLGQQLSTVAQTISVRDTLGVSRQIYFVGIGGFDTHSNQAQDLPGLLGQIDGAVSAFFAAMQELGIENDVTLFTASDFGRTLAINGDGTDHGWGGHHFVVGGAVAGQTIYGALPVADFNHAQDASGGRLIPSLSVEQMAAPLGRWFGLNDSEIAAALPGLAAFGGSEPGFI
ncbi:MAG: DUF1501 domain-containing protein [Pseudomonadota bacterium]